MKKNIPIFMSLVLFVGCSKHVELAKEVESNNVQEIKPAIELNKIENVYTQSHIRAFQVGRYQDPENEHLMHEAHTVYELIDDGRWNLNSNLPAAIPMGDAIVVALPEQKQEITVFELQAEQNTLHCTLEQILAENKELKMNLQKMKSRMEQLSKKLEEIKE